MGGACHHARMTSRGSGSPAATVDRATALRFRARVQELDTEPGGVADPTAAAILDAGVQDTGTGGAWWALATRGVALTAADRPPDLAVAWTLRGAPHAYRRSDLRAVERAVRPWSDADAAKRVFDAARALRAAGTSPQEAIGTAARVMRGVVVRPMAKGEVSTAMTAALPDAYLRWCRPCGATHMYEQTFRLAALHAGLELEPGTSPPVLRRVPGWPSSQVGRTEPAPPGAPLDLVRTTLHLLGPTTPAQVAAHLDSPVREVTSRWPADAVTVAVDGAVAWVLEADLPALRAAAQGDDRHVVRLLGPYDLFLQARDREVLVPDAQARRSLWPVLGRPGAVLVDGDLVGTWRPRAREGTLGLDVTPWGRWDRHVRRGVEAQHALLARYRGLTPPRPPG